jgi:S1-C subfamily serine protease
MLRSIFVGLVLTMAMTANAQDQAQYKGMIKHIQEVSVFVETNNGSSGSGVVFRRGEQLFVMTNWHVVRPAVVTEDGVTTYSELKVVKFGVHDGRMCERREVAAELVAYSDDEKGYDLAILRVRNPKFVEGAVEFYPAEEEIPFVGMTLYHVGCLNGDEAPASLTTGILSAQGRTIKKHIYDQITATSFPGSSGGGVFDPSGKCIGILTRRSGETLGYINPVREIREWTKANDLEWVVNSNLPAPKREELIFRRDAKLEGRSEAAIKGMSAEQQDKLRENIRVLLLGFPK